MAGGIWFYDHAVELTINRSAYQHCAEKHLHRYLAEFDFRYNSCVALGVNDIVRADNAFKDIVGKRLTYRTVNN